MDSNSEGEYSKHRARTARPSRFVGVTVAVTSEIPCAAPAIGAISSGAIIFPDPTAFPLAGHRRSDMTYSKLRFGFLAVVLATASAAVVAQEAASPDAQLKATVVESLDQHAEL